MTPDSCPYCGAEKNADGREWRWWVCGSHSTGTPGKYYQHPMCARYVRVRIGQLKRIVTSIPRSVERAGYGIGLPLTEDGYYAAKRARSARWNRFRSACIREIDRLRGGA